MLSGGRSLVAHACNSTAYTYSKWVDQTTYDFEVLETSDMTTHTYRWLYTLDVYMVQSIKHKNTMNSELIATEFCWAVLDSKFN